jgi:membrane fusion protein (multidrug efflux system)
MTSLRFGCAVTAALMGCAPTMAAPTATAAEDSERIRTQLVAQHDVVISSQVEGQIAQLPLKDGDAFRRGQLLVAFDCELYEAQLRKAEASAEAADKVYVVNKQLVTLRSVGELDVEQAKAKAKEADAEAAYVRATVSRCRVTAPFGGHIAKRLAAQFEYVPAGKPLLQIVDSENLELKLNVPSVWLAWLRIGSTLQIHIDDLNVDYAAAIVRLGARVDPVSQTLEVIASIKGNPVELLPGMSGWARFPPRR